jgi:hypothetical protein
VARGLHRTSGKAFPKWLVIQSSPSSKASFLRELLRKKFPTYSFLHSKPFQDKKRLPKDSFDGIILELKSLSKSTLSIYDKLNKTYRNNAKILVVTPNGYQLLNLRRKKALDHSLIILSETKSLDYILQLPRFIEEVGRKKRLRLQNERLQRLIRMRLPHLQSFSGSLSDSISVNTKETIRDLLGEDARGRNNQQCGLKLKLKTWDKIRNILNSSAQTEVFDLIYRLIHGIVRNSDHVLRSAEDEFLIFLSNTQEANLSRCKERLERALKSFRIEANSQSLRFPVQIVSLDRLSYISN